MSFSKKPKLALLTTIMIIALAAKAQAMPATYFVEYDPNSTLKKLSLKNASLKVKVYYYGIPRGFETVQTGEDQRFIFSYMDNTSVSLEVIGVKGEEKYQSLCTGIASDADALTIVIRCRSIKP